MARNTELRQFEGPALAGHPRGRVLVAAAALAALVAGLLVLAGPSDSDRPVLPSFLVAELGAPDRSAPLSHTPADGVEVSIQNDAYRVSAGADSLALALDQGDASSWQPHTGGAVRTTSFGEEIVTVRPTVTEQYLTVRERQGRKTWRWHLSTGTLKPTLRPDGSVLVSAGNAVAGFRISPAAILDEDGKDVTPEGTSWSLERRKDDIWLTLFVDDAELPLPYVIDPATIFTRNFAGSNNAGGATTIVLTKPASLAVNDMMVAQIGYKGGTGAYPCGPAANPTSWTALSVPTNSTTSVGQLLYWKVANANDVAAANFTFTFYTNSTCVTAGVARKASGGIAAYYGVDNSVVPSVNTGRANASSTTSTANTATWTASWRWLSFFTSSTGNAGTTNWSARAPSPPARSSAGTSPRRAAWRTRAPRARSSTPSATAPRTSRRS